MGQKHNITDLHQMQSLPLKAKIAMTNLRIQQWVEEYGEDGVYVSFSGGKDSMVLLDLVRKLYPSIVAVFVDTGLEYPEIREFVKRFENVEWLKPKKTFRRVITEYGYPFISKEVSDKVYGARRYLKELKEYNARRGGNVRYAWATADLTGIDRRIDPNNPAYQNLLHPNLDAPTENSRYQQIIGTYPGKDGKPSSYNFTKYQFFLDAPFEISASCCRIMKKSPVHSYARKTGRKPMTAQMASESRLRTSQWLKNECNGFNMKSPISNPMSFWTEQDVLLYIRIRQDEYDSNLRDCNLEVKCSADKRRRKMARNYIKKHKRFEICSVYGDIVGSNGEKESLPKNVADMGVLDLDRPLLKTTGCDRTGCMFCGYGCHLEKPGNGRFERMKLTHPKQYDYIMRPREQGGLGYKEIIDWINEHGNFDIRY